MNFRIEKGLREGKLFLMGDTWHCHRLSSVDRLLASDIFRSHNPELIPILEKAREMMSRGEVGPVKI